MRHDVMHHTVRYGITVAAAAFSVAAEMDWKKITRQPIRPPMQHGMADVTALAALTPATAATAVPVVVQIGPK